MAYILTFRSWCLLLLLVGVTPAVADTPQIEVLEREAKRLWTEGKTLEADGDQPGATSALKRSLALRRQALSLRQLTILTNDGSTFGEEPSWNLPDQILDRAVWRIRHPPSLAFKVCQPGRAISVLQRQEGEAFLDAGPKQECFSYRESEFLKEQHLVHVFSPQHLGFSHDDSVIAWKPISPSWLACKARSILESIFFTGWDGNVVRPIRVLSASGKETFLMELVLGKDDAQRFIGWARGTSFATSVNLPDPDQAVDQRSKLNVLPPPRFCVKRRHYSEAPKRILSWIDLDSGLITRQQFFDLEGEVISEVALREVRYAVPIQDSSFDVTPDARLVEDSMDVHRAASFTISELRSEL